MANDIDFKKGTKANLPTLNQGEPAYCTDTDEVFIGDGATNHQLALIADIASKALYWARRVR